MAALGTQRNSHSHWRGDMDGVGIEDLSYMWDLKAEEELGEKRRKKGVCQACGKTTGPSRSCKWFVWRRWNPSFQESWTLNATPSHLGSTRAVWSPCCICESEHSDGLCLVLVPPGVLHRPLWNSGDTEEENRRDRPVLLSDARECLNVLEEGCKDSLSCLSSRPVLLYVL